MKFWPPQLTRTFCALPLSLYAISALDPSGLTQATFGTAELAVEAIR